VYARFPAGRSCPGGYIVPVEPTGRAIKGHTQVKLTVAPPRDHLSWTQWIRNTQLLTDEEAERE